MSRGRRKTIIGIVEGTALGLVCLDLLLYFALVRPLRSMRATEEASYEAARNRIRNLESRSERLQKYQAAVPQAEGQISDFLKEHISARRQGFSRAVRLVREMTDSSKLRLISVSYKLDPSREDPFARLALQVDVEGPFPSLLDFLHALETAKDVIVLRDCSFEPAEGRTLALRLAAELYLQR